MRKALYFECEDSKAFLAEMEKRKLKDAQI